MGQAGQACHYNAILLSICKLHALIPGFLFLVPPPNCYNLFKQHNF